MVNPLLEVMAPFIFPILLFWFTVIVALVEIIVTCHAWRRHLKPSRFCDICGTPAKASNSSFCRHCGTPLRKAA